HARDDDRRRATLEHFGDVLADLLERVEALSFDLFGHDDDVDAREVIGDRLATRRRLPRVLLHDLLVHERIDLGVGALAEHELENSERELRAVVAEPFALLTEEAALELAAALEHLLVELAVVIALRL